MQNFATILLVHVTIFDKNSLMLFITSNSNSPGNAKSLPAIVSLSVLLFFKVFHAKNLK